jgi:UDP-N-acetylglucosamine--N-acetylmuramyl-(pentapeptide) pyrophosphoryl-undecaprenol N-acetylglucosamine transferase
VAELAAVGVGAIVVPLPGAIADEQSANARFLVDAGAAVMVPQRELTPEALAARIEACTRQSLLAMAVAARKVARPDAAERVADACIALGMPR